MAKDTVLIDGEISLIIPIDGDIDLELATDGEFGIITVVDDIPVYQGATTVTPILNNSIILRTANKKVIEDVEVLEIPVTYTTNPYDGKTVVIG